jgi:hypothetical protein
MLAEEFTRLQRSDRTSAYADAALIKTETGVKLVAAEGRLLRRRRRGGPDTDFLNQAMQAWVEIEQRGGTARPVAAYPAVRRVLTYCRSP